jgi:hypothetical protein
MSSAVTGVSEVFPRFGLTRGDFGGKTSLTA